MNILYDCPFCSKPLSVVHNHPKIYRDCKNSDCKAGNVKPSFISTQRFDVMNYLCFHYQNLFINVNFIENSTIIWENCKIILYLPFLIEPDFPNLNKFNNKIQTCLNLS